MLWLQRWSYSELTNRPPHAGHAARTNRRGQRRSARANDTADRILPVSARAAGLRDETRLGKRLEPYSLERIRAPTLVVGARDDGLGTYAAAEYTASRIAGATLIGFENGGHLLVRHDAAVRIEIGKLLAAQTEHY